MAADDLVGGLIAITIVTVIVVPGLWERTSDPRVRGQVVLFNLATAITVTLGIVSLYSVLFLLILAGAGLVTAPQTFAQAVGRDVGFADYATLAWFVASLSTIGRTRLGARVGGRRPRRRLRVGHGGGGRRR